MGRSEAYRAALRALPADGWDAWLAASSGLPGPRANLALAQVVADEAPPATLRRYATADDGPALGRPREHQEVEDAPGRPERWARLRELAGLEPRS